MILIVIILLASIAAIIFALIYKAKSDTKKQIQRLKDHLAEVASQYQITWSEQYICKHRAFAWCRNKRILFFMDFPDERGRIHVIDMNQVSQCNLKERTGSGATDKRPGDDKNIDNVDIELYLENKECINLPMYKETEDGIFERIRLTNKAKHWISLIQAKEKAL